MPCQGPWGGGYGDGNTDRKDYLEAERRLCEARWLILQLNQLSGAGQRLPKNLKDLVAKHTAEQLKHRRGDKRHVLDAIKNTMRRVREDMSEIEKLGGVVSKRMADQLETLESERTRIRAITDEELLADYWATEKRLKSDVVDHDD